ncbi:flavin-containing monooxygenase [Pseudarthrobacter sp. NKDBFgelt]|uniref:flavin-containing monooxygenase n=1 Tax=Pseudarthrobacter sp. NKDBFgelt TaxID=3384443 RepID=UPI0038D4A2EE
MTHPTEPETKQTVIVGSGFSGLCAAINLKKAGFHDFVILEKATDVGGTWRDNSYPGSACDVPSVLYSFSFFQNPAWTRKFPSWSELHAYLRQVAEHFDLWSHLRFGVEVDEIRFDQPSGTWTVSTDDGQTFEAKYVINATGVLSKPAIPNIPGLESFEGTAFHSARWRHDLSLSGRRVAVIGTGASAIQFVPQIAKEVSQLTIFQRSPHWIMPRGDQEIPLSRRVLYRRLPFLQRLERWKTYWEFEWLARGFLGHPKVVEGYRQLALGYLEASVKDDSLRETLTPDYTPGCKRRLVSDDWFPTLQRENVELVTTGIDRITPDSVITTDGVEHAVDTIVFGTGFAATDFIAPIKVTGIGGQELSTVWTGGAATLHGISTAGFPNFFTMLGPNTTLGHNSMVFMIEAQARYITSAIERTHALGDAAANLHPDVQEAAYTRLQKKMKGTVWMSGCHSWYQSADGRIDTLWPGTTIEYWVRTRKFRLEDHDVLRPLTRAQEKQPGQYVG